MNKVSDNQSLFDLAVQYSGSVEAAFALALINGLSVTDIPGKSESFIPAPVYDRDVVSFFKVSELPATAGDEDSIVFAPADLSLVYISVEAGRLNRVIIFDNQSLFDLAVQYSGSVEAAFALALINGLSVTDIPGKESDLLLPEVIAKDICEEFRLKEWIAASASISDIESPGIILEGIGYWAIGVDFVVS